MAYQSPSPAASVPASATWYAVSDYRRDSAAAAATEGDRKNLRNFYVPLTLFFPPVRTHLAVRVPLGDS